MRALAVLYCYPPLLVPAAMCYLKLMAGLRHSEVEVEIVTISPDSFQSPGPIPLDPSLEAVLPSGITNHAVHSPERSFWIKALKRLDPSRRLSYRWLEPKKREWTYPALRYLRQLDLSRYDVLLTCSQPHANHLLGLELQKQSGIPWIAYFSDPWTDNPYVRYGSKRVLAFNRELEEQVLACADLVLFTCEEMRELVAREHRILDRDRSGILPHAFVPEWYALEGRQSRVEQGKAVAGEVSEERSLEDGENVQRRPPIRLLQTGSFYGARTPLPLIEALQRVAQRHSLEGLLRIDSYGGMDERYQEVIAREGLADVIGVHGFIPYLQTLSKMKDHDALLLIDAPLTTTSQSVFLPSKLIDYLGSHCPIIAVTPESGATARVVREIGGIVCPLEDDRGLEHLLLEIIQSGAIPYSPRPERIARYDYREVGQSLAQRMLRLIA